MDESKSSNRLPFGHYWKWSLIKFDLGACSSAIFRNSRTNIYHEWWVGPRATKWKKLDFKSAWVYFCKVVGNNSLLINHLWNADVLKWQWKKKTQIVFEIKSKRRCQQIEKQKRRSSNAKNVKCALLETFWLPFMDGKRNTCKYAEIGNNKQLSWPWTWDLRFAFHLIAFTSS